MSSGAVVQVGVWEAGRWWSAPEEELSSKGGGHDVRSSCLVLNAACMMTLVPVHRIQPHYEVQTEKNTPPKFPIRSSCTERARAHAWQL